MARGWWLTWLMAGCVGTTPTAPPDVPENVLLVLLDDIGTDQVDFYGENPDAAHMPHFAALADQGLLFRNAHANPACGPTRATLLTGRYVRRYGVGAIIKPDAAWGLPLAERTLPERLSSAPGAWTSAMVGKWHLNPITDGLRAPLAQGFASARGPWANLREPVFSDSNRLGYYYWHKVVDGRMQAVERYATTDQIDDAVEAVDTLPEPWFLYVALSAAHIPRHEPPPELLGDAPGPEVDPDPYPRMVRAADTELGRLLSAVDLSRTTVIVLGDNGTPSRQGTPDGQAKGTVYESGTHVPLVIAGPRVAHPGTETEALAHAVDVAATIAHIGRANTVDMDGVSLLPALADPAARPRAYLYTEMMFPSGPPPWEEERQSLRDARYKLMRGPEGEALYDLQGRVVEGPNLLEGPLSEEARAAWANLGARLDALLARTPFEH